MKNTTTTGIAVALAATSLGGAAAAQSDAERIAALEARVSELESDQGEALTFGSESGTVVEFYGYLKSDAIYDFGPELGNTTFGLVGIGPDSDDDGAFTGTVNQTRLGFRTTTQTGMGELGTQVELDFYGVQLSAKIAEHQTLMDETHLFLSGAEGRRWVLFGRWRGG